MGNMSDSEGNPLKIHILYTDKDLGSTSFKHSSICFIESYIMGKRSLEDEVVMRYESGLFRTLNSPENLNLIGRRNASGDVSFENIRNYALKSSTQEEIMKRYNTTNLDEILANLSAQELTENEGLIKRAERDMPGLIQKGIESIEENAPDLDNSPYKKFYK